MLNEQTITKMNEMKLFGMAKGFAQRNGKADHGELSHAEFVGLLIDDKKLRFASRRAMPDELQEQLKIWGIEIWPRPKHRVHGPIRAIAQSRFTGKRRFSKKTRPITVKGGKEKIMLNEQTIAKMNRMKPFGMAKGFAERAARPDHAELSRQKGLA